LQSYDAIVGDVTILANRSRNVSFTQPYTESGLSLILPAESDDSAWLFMKPFSTEMWIATVGILIYTMIIIWFLEHHLNPEFGGPLKTQITTTMWFAFTSLFFAHSKSRLQSSKFLQFLFCYIWKKNSFVIDSNMIFFILMYIRGENKQQLSKNSSWSMVISCVCYNLKLHCKSFIIAYCPKIEVCERH